MKDKLFLKGFLIGTFLAIVTIALLIMSLSSNSNKLVDRNIISNLVNKDNIKVEIQESKFYLVNFWATWCKPCVEEMPLLLELSEELKEYGVETICISNEKNKNKVLKFIQKKDMKILYFQKNDMPYTKILPTTILLDENFNIILSKKGKISDALKDEIIKLIE